MQELVNSKAHDQETSKASLCLVNMPGSSGYSAMAKDIEIMTEPLTRTDCD